MVLVSFVFSAWNLEVMHTISWRTYIIGVDMQKRLKTHRRTIVEFCLGYETIKVKIILVFGSFELGKNIFCLIDCILEERSFIRLKELP